MPRRELHAAAYSAAMAAAILILWAAWAANKRERELLALSADCEKDLVQLRTSKRQVEGERDAARKESSWPLAGLPTDALVIVTEQGYLCPEGLDHPSGSRAGAPDPSDRCPGCVKYLDHYDPPA